MVIEEALLAMHVKDNGGRNGTVVAGVDADGIPWIFGILAQHVVAQDPLKEAHEGGLIPYRDVSPEQTLHEGEIPVFMDLFASMGKKAVGMIQLG